MPFKDPEKRREYVRKYYSSPEQKAKKKVYDHQRYLKTGDTYRLSRSMHTVPHRFLYEGDWICDSCGSPNDLVIHHVNGNHKDNNSSNLRCLCVSCHSKLHIKHRARSVTGQVISINN